MTTIQVPVGELVAEARQIRFSRVMLTLLLGFFWLPGWVAGKAWLGIALAFVGARRGWRDATGWVPPEPARRAGA